MKLLTIIISLISISAFGVTVTDYGAAGDARQVWVSTTNGSVAIGFTNTLSSGDIGKTVELFDVGQMRVGMDVNNGVIGGWNSVVIPDGSTRSVLIGTITNIVGEQLYIDVARAEVPAGTNFIVGPGKPGAGQLPVAGSLPSQYTLTSPLDGSNIGKGIVLYNGSGFFVYANPPATNYQGLIAVITNVSGNTAYISGDVPQLTASSVYCYYGTDNAPKFQAAIDAATGTNTIINIPAGNYLMLPAIQYTNWVPNGNFFITKLQALTLTKGGIQFAGAGRDHTILTSQGAWKYQSGWWANDYEPDNVQYLEFCSRGQCFNCVAPIDNDYPIIFKDLTFDGGMSRADTGHQGTQPANAIDGLGWDGSSAAGVDSGQGYPPLFKGFYNCEFRHFMGEMIKGITGSAGSSDTVVSNCVFWDGNGTAFNYNSSHTITGCTFSDMYQIEEFYLKYSNVRPSYFINNFATNIWHNFVSLNGGTLTNQPYIISNNVLYGYFGGNAIGACPAANVTVADNTIVGQTGAYITALNIGQNGIQAGSPDACNTNWQVYGNHFKNCKTVVHIGGTSSSTDNNRVEGLWYHNNTADGGVLFSDDGWANNLNVYSNDFGGISGIDVQSGAYGSTYAKVETNNLYWSTKIMNGEWGWTNSYSYANGCRFYMTYPYSGTANYLTVADRDQIPSGAVIIVTNAVYNGVAVPVYLSESMTDSVTIPYQGVQAFYWNGSAWSTNSSGDSPIPPVYPVFIPGHKYYRLKTH